MMKQNGILISGKRIVLSMILATLLGGALYANCDVDKGHKGDRTHFSKDKFNKHSKDGHFFGMFKELNLTAEQNEKIKNIIEDIRKDNKFINEAFTKDSFDKAKYSKIISEKRENMLKSQVEILEKSYAILTPKQKEQLKVLLDLKAEKK
ncbi:Spy/CpxP family protein refolding chaperone [Aliarcobacter lanthieri]|uniref:Spy/CpxP family protein refolding chaperone n=1 Tax=Aliarcobacter lanthieri TaxID=1355374 RepID=UPI000A556693|nr:Spy/CpxP family protein refolding chaperone [Aliarcobacter lanthieri]QKF58598.1 CpxP family two-component system-associated protein [Aliarcobacter lanthieri]